MLVIRLAWRERAAAAQIELPPDERERVAQRARIRERPEVTRAVVLFEPREGEVRNRVVQIHLEHQEPLVVAETDVVARMKFLDELAFEQERLRFAADDVKSKSRIASTSALNFKSQPMRRDGWKYWLTRLRRSRALPT